jgi:hypothetical protein
VYGSAAARVAPPGVGRDVRVLRWTFRRDEETLVCELGLTLDDSAYELRFQPPWNVTGTSVELFDDAIGAFQRHGALERRLISEGWSLERFQSERLGR